MSKHTKCPWEIEIRDEKNYKKGIITIKQGSGLDYDTVSTLYPCNSTFGKSLANAKLIASAPDLLQACQEMVKHLTETDFDVCGTSDEELKRWKDAIKKATE